MNIEADKLANEILNLARNKLLVNIRFMDVALSYHKRLAYEGSLATDGHTLLYDPGFVLRMYKASQEEMVRMYLHMILHCVFQHPFVGFSIDERFWNLACDIAVESTITDLGLKGTASPKEALQQSVIVELKKGFKFLTAEKIYAFLKVADYSDEILTDWEKAYRADNHAPWYEWALHINTIPVEATDDKGAEILPFPQRADPAGSVRQCRAAHSY